MKAKCSVRLWKRDYDIVDLLGHGVFCSSQLARLFFSSRKKCAERMKKLFAKGLVGRFPKPLLDVRGKPEFVYCEKGKELRKLLKLRHGLAVSQFFVLWKVWLGSVKDFSGKYFFGNEIPKIADGCLVPDGAFVLKKGAKELLFFVEVDLGSESLRAFGGYSLEGKFSFYDDYFDSGRFRDDFRGDFGSFRTLLVFDSEERLLNALDLVREHGCDFVLASTFERIQNRGVGGRCWFGVDGVCDVFGKK